MDHTCTGREETLRRGVVASTFVAAEPIEIEVPSFAAGAPAFLEWAGQDADVRVVYGPDPILAVDEPGRRAVLVDDVYLAVAWVAEGGDELVEAMRDCGVAAKSRPTQPTHDHELLIMVMRKGSPVPQPGT